MLIKISIILSAFFITDHVYCMSKAKPLSKEIFDSIKTLQDVEQNKKNANVIDTSTYVFQSYNTLGTHKYFKHCELSKDGTIKIVESKKTRFMTNIIYDTMLATTCLGLFACLESTPIRTCLSSLFGF